jgi:uncharacterized protein DUF222/HNH endonuclease
MVREQLADQLAELDRMLDSLHAADRSQLAGLDLIKAVYRIKNRIDAVVAKVSAVYDDSGEWSETGAKSAGAAIATNTGESLGLTRAMVRHGKKLKKMSYVAEAYANGDIGADHVALFARVHNRATAEAFGRDEKDLVGEACRQRFSRFKRQLGYWYAETDPDSAERDFDKQTERRSFYFSRVLDMYYGDLRLDPIGGEILWGALRRIEEEFLAIDWAEARERLGDGACAGDLRRSSSQRLADALVEMAKRATAMPADARKPEPLFCVLVGYETFAGPICETLGGAYVPPSAAANWLDGAWVERIVFDSPSRVIDVGQQRRIFTGATRRAVEIRDRECFHPTCEEPIDRCQVDHITPWSWGGPTVIDNGRLACGFHNRQRNKRDGPGP